MPKTVNSNKKEEPLYAIIEAGGRQWKVEPGSPIDINRLSIEPGKEHVVKDVLFARNGQSIQVGCPYVSGAKVVCEVVEHRKGPKAISFRFHRRENVRRKRGHRQPLTRLQVKDITL